MSLALRPSSPAALRASPAESAALAAVLAGAGAESDTGAIHRAALQEFALECAPPMLTTLDTAWERFGKTPERLWDACAKRYGEGATAPFLAKVRARCDLARVLREHAAACAAWEVGLVAALAACSTASGANSSSADAVDAARAAGLVVSASAASYCEPPADAVVVDARGVVVLDGAPRTSGHALLALTPCSASTVPIASLGAALLALTRISHSNWRALGAVRKASTPLGVVYGTLCVLFGVEATWRSALGVASDSALPQKLAALTAQGWALASAVATARGSGAGSDNAPPSQDLAAQPSPSFPGMPPLSIKRVTLAAKLLCKRPDIRAEVAALVLVSSPAGGSDEPGASAPGAPETVLGPFPALPALLEWQLALVLAVTQGLRASDADAPPPTRVTLLGLALAPPSRPVSREAAARPALRGDAESPARSPLPGGHHREKLVSPLVGARSPLSVSSGGGRR